METHSNDYDLSTLKELLPLWINKQTQLRRVVNTYTSLFVITAVLIFDTSISLNDIDEVSIAGMSVEGLYVLYAMSAIMWILFIRFGSSYLKQLTMLQLVAKINLDISPSRKFIREWYRDAQVVNVFHDLFTGGSNRLLIDLVVLSFYLTGIAVGQYLTILVASSAHIVLSIVLCSIYIAYYAVFFIGITKTYPMQKYPRFVFGFFVTLSIVANLYCIYQYAGITHEDFRCEIPLSQILSTDPFSHAICESSVDGLTDINNIKVPWTTRFVN